MLDLAKSRMEKLSKQKQRVEEAIRKLQMAESKRLRKEETQKKVLIGAMTLQKLERGEMSQAELLEALDAFLVRESDRAVFGLPPKG